ncbi:hypothetical protein DV738_g4106, partial [Chaetothyriales sp. CBS 135597]
MSVLRSAMLGGALASLAHAFTQPTTPSWGPLLTPDVNTPVTQGETFTITWDPASHPTDGVTVSIVLCSGPSTNCVTEQSAIVEGVPAAAKSFEWAVPCTISPGTASTETGHGLLIIVDGTGEFQYSTQFSVLANPGCPSDVATSTSSVPSTDISTDSSSAASTDSSVYGIPSTTDASISTSSAVVTSSAPAPSSATQNITSTAVPQTSSWYPTTGPASSSIVNGTSPSSSSWGESSTTSTSEASSTTTDEVATGAAVAMQVANAGVFGAALLAGAAGVFAF